MTQWNKYQQAAQAYAGGVAALLGLDVSPASTATPSKRDSAPHQMSAPTLSGQDSAPALVAQSTDLAERAAQLAPLADELTLAASALFMNHDPLVRADAGSRLLAKALTDLHVSAHLLAAAQAEAAPETTVREAGFAPATAPAAALDHAEVGPALAILLAGRAVWPTPAQAREAALGAPDLAGMRLELARAIVDTLVSIRDRAARTGQRALGGLLGLGAGQLAQAAGIVGLDIAQALGQAQQVTRLYELCRAFALKSYDTLLALLGPALARIAAEQVVTWVTQLQSGAEFGKLLEKLYETASTGAILGQLAVTSQAAPERFAAAGAAITTLKAQYAQQIDLADKVLTSLALVGIAPAAAIPQGRLLLAASFMVLGSYVILTGADFVDAPHFWRLNRVPGVREIVAHNLQPA
jgi:hypothetical protein